MRCALACFVSVVGCTLVAGQILEPPQQMKYADKAFLEKQKFLLEIVHRIENPLLFEEYLKFRESGLYGELFEKWVCFKKSGELEDFVGALIDSSSQRRVIRNMYK